MSLKLFSTFFPCSPFLSFLSFFPSSLCFYVFIFDTKSYYVVQADMIFPYHHLHDPPNFPSLKAFGIKNMCYHIYHNDIFMDFVALETQSECAQGKQKKKVNKNEVAMEFCYKWQQRNDTICRRQWMETNTHIYILRLLVEYRWKIDDVSENRVSLRNLYWSKFSTVRVHMHVEGLAFGK